MMNQNQMAYLASLLEQFIHEIEAVATKEKYILNLRSDTLLLLETLRDPFTLWGVDDRLLSELSSYRKKLQSSPVRSLYPKILNYKNQIVSELGKLISSIKNETKISDDSPEASGLLQQLSVRQDELNEAIADSLQKVDERTGAAERHVDRVQRNAIAEIRREVSELKEAHSAELTVQKRDAVSDIETTLEKAGSKLSLTIKEATDTLLKRHQQDYDKLYIELNNKTQDQIRQTDEIRSDFDRKIDTLNSAFEQQAENLNSRFDQEQESFKLAFQDSIKQEVANYKTVRRLLKEQLDEAKEVVGTLSKKALAHEHLKQAEREAFAYWGFQGAGLLFLFTAILMSVAIFGDSLGLRLPWLTWLVEFSETSGAIQIQGSTAAGSASEATWFFKRISIVVLLTAPGLYLLKEAANHRAKENLYRQRGVQLASITPYLKELEETERNSIKKELVQSFFSFHDGKADTQNVPDFLRDLKETTKIIRSIDRATQPTTNKRTFRRRKRLTSSVES
ncbi:hypothetical protein ACRTEU_00645 [Vibrio alginolyticus]|uniref:hypothetical protein n=2 Tax=Vibrio alginolyticus TaxID=663 RepID=UPI00215D14FA|nr:hypothetical protein [Vibrio alginolyticus]MCR9313670.1 hypothetical protein [Vibrio alginolyticus]MCR9319459.1 hypothetical protein [Vibrio alginolyticus]MCR9479752.1 hypothetical protein [Vibrio alginolyticus]MCS0105343.1 hypothetical protein [Vibrio alginolyticus]